MSRRDSILLWHRLTVSRSILQSETVVGGSFEEEYRRLFRSSFPWPSVTVFGSTKTIRLPLWREMAREMSARSIRLIGESV